MTIAIITIIVITACWFTGSVIYVSQKRNAITDSAAELYVAGKARGMHIKDIEILINETNGANVSQEWLLSQRMLYIGDEQDMLIIARSVFDICCLHGCFRKPKTLIGEEMSAEDKEKVIRIMQEVESKIRILRNKINKIGLTEAEWSNKFVAHRLNR